MIVVDDGSRDQTAQVVEAFRSQHPSVTCIRNDHRGKAYAVRTGVLRARGDRVLFSDADLSTPIEETARLLDWFERGYDIVIGSREGAGARRIDEPFYRHLMGRVYNFVVRALTVRGINDTQCGFKAFRHDVAKEIFNRVQLYGDRAGVIRNSMVTGFDVELLFIAQKAGYGIKEVPVAWQYGTESKVSPIKDSWRLLRDVLRVRWNDWLGRYDVPK